MKKAVYIYLIFGLIFITGFTGLHKYYVSITQVEYVDEQKSLQFITRIFADDLELTLNHNYNRNFQLSPEQETDSVDSYIKRYFDSKFKVIINDSLIKPKYLGKEYLNDVVICYLEIENISEISKLEMSNSILFDTFSDQKNIIRLNINDQYKSFIQNEEQKSSLLIFD